MKKRLLGLVLAFILIFSLLPMTALAEDPTVSVKFNNNVVSAFTLSVKPGETAYVITDDSAQFVKWTDSAAPTDKFIKLDYPADGAATLKVTFNNIEADVTSSAFHNYAICFNSGEYAVELTLVGVNKISHGASACLKYYNAKGMTITGDGSLELTNTGSVHGAIWADGGDLLIKNTSMKFSVLQGNGSLHHAILATKGNVTLDGVKFETVTDGGCQVFFGKAQKEGDKDGRYTLDTDDSRKLVIKNSEITFTVNQGKTAFKTQSPATISNSTLKLTTKGSEGPLLSPAPTFEGEYTAIAGLAKNANKPEKLKEFSAKKLGSYTYVYIVPGKVDLIPTTEPTTEPTTAPTTAPAEDTKPADATKPVDTTKPVEDTKPADNKNETTKPVTDNKNETTKPVTDQDTGKDNTAAENSGNPLKLVLIVMIVLAVCAVGAVGVIFFLRRKNAAAEEAETEEAESEEA